MTIREKLGQMLMFGFPGKTLDDIPLRLIREYKCGNIILFSHNIESAGQLRSLCEIIQKEVLTHTGRPAFIAVDQEGGVVSRMPEDATNFPSPMAVSSTGIVKNAYLAGFYTANELCDMGVNFNMAPCMDINTNPANPVIGVRSYGDSHERATPYALAMIHGLMDGGVISCAKHFPGHGNTAVDSHLGLPSVDKTEEELFSNELLPFIDAIRDGVPSVMTSHILFPKIEKRKVPATMSSVILKDLLRKKLGFTGIIISDSLEMDAISKYYGTTDGFVESLRAGVNIGCISHSPSVAIEALEKAEQAVENNTLGMEDLDASVEIILDQKQKFAALKPRTYLAGSPLHRESALSISKKSIVRIGRSDNMPLPDKNTFFTGCYAYRATFASSALNHDISFAEYMASVFGGQFSVTPVNPKESDISDSLNKTHTGQTVVICTYNGHINREQIELVNALCENRRCVITVAMRNPYDLTMIDDRAYKLAAFEYTPLSLKSVELVLRGALCEGKLNITMK